MLSPTSSREILFVFLSSPPWKRPSFTVKQTLSSPCFRSDPFLSCQNATLAHLVFLPPHNLVIWTDSSVFFFLLAKAALASLQTGLFVVLRPPFPFWQAQFVQVFPLKPAPFCTLFAGLASTKSLPLIFLSNSRSVLNTLSARSSFPLPQTLSQIWQESSFLSSFIIRLKWISRYSFFFQQTMQLTSQPGGNCYFSLLQSRVLRVLLFPSAVPCTESATSPFCSPA